MGSSSKRKRLKALKSKTSMDIDEMIHLASRKLYPVIEMLIDNSTKSDIFLTRKEFDNAIIAANIIKEIYQVLVYAEFEINPRNIDFALENYKVTLNDQDKIYVETGLLLQLIDLYNILEDAKDIIDRFYKSIGIHSSVQTESGPFLHSDESLNPNRIVLRLTKPLTNSSTSFSLLQKNFIVMPSTNDSLPLRESKSQISANSKKSSKDSSVRRNKSTGSLAHEEMIEVTDVYGAKRVVVKCIYDLQEVSRYLGIERKDASTICSRVEVYSSPSSSRPIFDRSDSEISIKSEEIEFERERSEVKRDKSDLKRDKSELKRDKSELKREESRLKSEASVSREKSELKRDKSELKREKSEPKREKSALKKDKSELKREESLPKSDESVPREKSELKRDKSELKREKSEPKREKSALKKDKSDLKREESELKSDTSLPREKSELQREKSELQREKSGLQREKSELQRDKSELKREKSEQKSDGEGETECCCPECFADIARSSRADLQECDDDKIIICIKGCNEDEGDVQIVIRQCPDCKKAEEPTDKSWTKSVSRDKIEPAAKKPSSLHQKLDKSKSKSKSAIEELTVINETDKVESISLHNKESQGSYECSDEEENGYKEQRASFASDTPSRPINEIDSTFFETTDSESFPKAMESKRISLKQPSSHQQSRVECSKIRMFETTNLCLQTETGQELVISVTVTPKDTTGSKKISLRDLFSEDDYPPKDHISDKAYFGPPEERASREKRHSVESTSSRKSVTVREPSKTTSYYAEERVIPLQRTKICSSVDFDVTTLETKIRDKGIQHKNAKIIVTLQELGIDNLLRACRPAKCCRKAVLNEKMKKCLPYPPSLRSLPLDEEDMDVINQSLQMSLQKVKNSTNLNKDFYANYSINPIQTIMYFFVENNKSNLSENIAVKRKLSYYINLVNDVEFRPVSQFDIFYFGVEEKANKKIPHGMNKSSGKLNQNVHTKHIVNEKNGGTIPDTPKRGNGNKYEDRPMLTGYTNLKQNDSKAIDKDTNLIKHQSKDLNDQTQKHIYSKMSCPSEMRSKKKAVVSRIPVYKGVNKSKSFSSENNDIDQIEQEVYGISLDSLPGEPGFKEDDLFSGLASKSSSTSQDKSSEKEIANHKNTILEQRGSVGKSSETSRYSVLSNLIPRKTKRKKKSFYLSRSKSDISMKTLKLKCQHRATNTQPKHVSIETLNKKCNTENNVKKICSISNNILIKQDSSNLILNYFSKMLYNMIIRESLKEKITENVEENTNIKRNFTETTKNKSLYELYKRFSNKNNRLVNVDVESVHHNLKAKKSQACILIASKNSRKNVCIINNLAIQTSVLFGDSKQCQTSNSLLPYLKKPKIKPEDTTYLQKKRLFKKIYNSEAVSGFHNSCDQLERFVVVFRSEHSLKSNISADTNFLSSASERSDRSLGNFSAHNINNSLLKLKETLEQYETVKNEIVHGSLQDADVNPIEYFVYQMCACNKFNKKPSIMQKLLSKSKGLFSSVDRDMCTKYRNQSKPAADKQLCHQCGCVISKCEGNISPVRNLDDSSTLCQCPPDNKPKKPLAPPCCKGQGSKNYKTISQFSKITHASMSSVKSLKTYFKKSLSNLKSRSKEKTLEPCSCDKQTTITKNVETFCLPDGANVVPCPKKDTSTGTTTDSATQKCECLKCENFGEDGTCCCSHCLGCLDKSFDTKPDNDTIGTLCTCLEEPRSKDNTKGNSDVTDKDTQRLDGNSNNVTSLNSTNKVKSESNADKLDTSSNTKHSQDNNSSSIAPNSNPVTPQLSSNSQQNEELINVGNNDVHPSDTNNDTASYYFLTSPPNMFTQFGLGSRNPFEQYLLNLPHMNMFRLNNSQTFLNE